MSVNLACIYCRRPATTPPLIGVSPQRMAELELELVKTVDELTRLIVVWALLPNHYHVLVDTFGGRIRCQESFVDQCRPLR